MSELEISVTIMTFVVGGICAAYVWVVEKLNLDREYWISFMIGILCMMAASLIVLKMKGYILVQ